MNITILTYGSRGDVQPFLPLSLGLMANGHRVKLVAPARFKELIEGYGISFIPLAGDPEELSKRLNDVGYNFVKMLRELMSHAVNIGDEIMRQTESACRDADLIVHTFAHAVGAHTFAREHNIPDVHVQTFPMFTPTGDYPNIAFPNFHIPALNRFTHIAAKKISWWTARFGFEQVRRRVGLPKRKLYFPFDENPLRPPTPVLCAWSPSLLPPSSDWAAHIHVTGYFFFNESMSTYQPPAELQNFLAAGEPPVCVSFGSMVNRNAKQIDEMVRASLKRTNNRGVILSGWGKVHQPVSDNVLYLDSASHDWLLPQCKMVIHHGGAGTTSAGLRAGIPTIVVPFTADQPFWGRRVYDAGVGVKPILVNQLSVEKLMQVIAEAEGDALRKRAQAFGRMMREEDGVSRAIDVIESCVLS